MASNRSQQHFVTAPLPNSTAQCIVYPFKLRVWNMLYYGCY